MTTQNYSVQMDEEYIDYLLDVSLCIFHEDASVVMKGRTFDYSTILNLVRAIDLSNNNFSGEIPVELTNLGALRLLNLSHNHFTGRIPENIVGKIPLSTQLQSLEASSFTGNELCGPPLTENCTATILTSDHDSGGGNDDGEIPEELKNLGALTSLNLSHNHFTGRIPESTDVIESLKSIDFSGNKLSGKIPQSISNLSFLCSLNFSNNFIGKVPLSTQLQSLEASCFTDNELCGPPLTENSTVTILISDHDSGGGNDDGSEHEVDWFYVGMALGFMVGFWGVISPLLINRR
ncbi:probable LRR receptor-like serine/threonine-protein kinase At4g36180 [Pistacia vera]|uniref:probable LRR receptor-like serine/threonine-protein kinase At4g36180 n=1 Tax=Pistacia vera TaxID=55513 RepID=UPI001263677E|nr:probable LRR receptor-like serine/threonine-protein kinase At4g36180 [Pistacia vera]